MKIIKNIRNIIITLILLSLSKLGVAVDGGIFGEKNGEKIKSGEIGFEDIPNLIINAINFLMGFAATISILFIIVGAYKILFGAMTQDRTKGRDTVIAATIGFILASLAWFIVKIILDNFN